MWLDVQDGQVQAWMFDTETSLTASIWTILNQDMKNAVEIQRLLYSAVDEFIPSVALKKWPGHDPKRKRRRTVPSAAASCVEDALRSSKHLVDGLFARSCWVHPRWTPPGEVIEFHIDTWCKKRSWPFAYMLDPTPLCYVLPLAWRVGWGGVQ